MIDRSLRILVGVDADLMTESDFQLVLLANFTLPLGIAQLSPILDSLIEPFNATPSSIGLMVTMYSAPAIFFTPLSGLLIDRYGRKPILTTGLFLFGAGGTIIAFTTWFPAVLGLRLIQGIGFATAFPTILTILGDLYSGSRETTAHGLRLTSSAVVQMVFPLIASAIIVVGWQYPFLLFGMALPVALIVHLFLVEPTVNSPTETKSDTNDDDSQEVPQHPNPSHLRKLARFAASQQIMSVLIAYFFMSFVYSVFITYYSLIIIRLLGGSPLIAGVIYTLFSVSYAITASQTGRLTSYSHGVEIMLVAGNISLGVGLALMALSSTIWLVGVWAIFVGIGAGTIFTLFRSLVTSFPPEQFRGGFVSIAETGSRTSITLGPVIVGAVFVLATPAFQFETILRWSVVSAGTLGGIISTVAILFARTMSEDFPI